MTENKSYFKYPIDMLTSFPIFSSVKEEIKSRGTSFFVREPEKISMAAYDRVMAYINNYIINIDPNDIISLFSFLQARAYVYLINDKLLINRMALWESTRFARILPEYKKDIHNITHEVFGLNVVYDKNYTVWMKLTDFLRSAKLFKSNDWHIINNNFVLSKGKVGVPLKKYFRLLQEMHYYKLLDYDNNKSKSVPDTWKLHIESLKKEWSIARPPVIQDTETVSYNGLHPPCILKILHDLKEGINIKHTARFALATYMLNIGMDEEEVVSLFRTTPDFNEDYTKYQVSSLKKYVPPGCDRMTSHNNCYPDNNCLSLNVRHPLFYKRVVKKKVDNENK